MKGYRIAFIRHGMTQANLDGRYIGTTDLPLCREGADQLYEKIEKYDYPSVQKVYTSPLKRCKQTISILQPNRLVAEMPELREMDFGKFENKTADELMNDPDYEQFIKGGLDNPPPNGECAYSARLPRPQSPPSQTTPETPDARIWRFRQPAIPGSAARM